MSILSPSLSATTMKDAASASVAIATMKTISTYNRTTSHTLICISTSPRRRSPHHESRIPHHAFVLAPPHATFFCAACATAGAAPSPSPAPGPPVPVPGARLGRMGKGEFLRPSRTRWACSVLRMNQPAKRRPTVDS